MLSKLKKSPVDLSHIFSSTHRSSWQSKLTDNMCPITGVLLLVIFIFPFPDICSAKEHVINVNAINGSDTDCCLLEFSLMLMAQKTLQHSLQLFLF